MSLASNKVHRSTNRHKVYHNSSREKVFHNSPRKSKLIDTELLNGVNSSNALNKSSIHVEKSEKFIEAYKPDLKTKHSLLSFMKASPKKSILDTKGFMSNFNSRQKK